MAEAEEQRGTAQGPGSAPAAGGASGAAGASGAELVGLSVAAGDLEITEQMARDMAAATGVDPDSGELPHTIAAPLTAGVQDALIGDPRLAIDLSRTMHTEQKIEVAAPLQVGGTYSATATVDTVRDAAGGRIIAFSTEVRDRAGEIVQTLRTSLLTAQPEETDTSGEADRA